MATIAKRLFDDSKEKAEKEASSKEPIKVYLRIRPLTTEERKNNEDQGCVIKRENTLVELRAPPSSFTFKSSNHGASDVMSQFPFSHIFPDETTQKMFFDSTMLPIVEDVLNGHNGLVFTYGVTNSGKTYTVQGTPKDGGILPRSLDVIFNSIADKKYTTPDLKPNLFQGIAKLDAAQVKKEENLRNTIFAFGEKPSHELSVLKNLNSTTKSSNNTLSRDNTLISNISVIQKSGNSSDDLHMEAQPRVVDNTILNVDAGEGVTFGVWVSFVEIYNELIHDLLQLEPIGKGKKRPALRLGEDKSGNPYVKGVSEVFVTSSDEAYKVLRVGQRNRHQAATKLNQLSSRSHAIFSMKLLKIVTGEEGQHVSRISRLSIVDLAGSERYTKTGALGELMKEASNINCSIMTLGKCISMLRYNQEHPNHPTIVPFRESKLTRLFQGYFLGKGKASMIVNISPCASIFDETYNVLKFSSVAKEVKMKAERATELWAVPPTPRSLLQSQKVPSTPSNVMSTPGQKRIPLCIVTPSTTLQQNKRSLNDPTDFTYNELVDIVKELNEKVKKERREKALLEKSVREEMTGEYTSMMEEIQESHRVEMEETRESLIQTMEKRLDNLTRTTEKHRKRRKVNDENEGSSYNSSSSIIQFEEMKVELEQYKVHVHAVEAENKKLRVIQKEMHEAEETLKIQNKAMKEMQKKLQDKDDEIEKLQEELEDQQPSSSSGSSENDKALFRQMKEENDLKEERINQLTAQLTHEENERGSKVNEVEKMLDMLHKDLEKAQAQRIDHDSLTKQLQNVQQALKEKDEELALLQFELDESKCKVEKYEGLLDHHKETLADSENIIEQLNEQLFILKTELANTEKLEPFPTMEIGINTSVGLVEQVANGASVDSNVNTSLEAHNADVGMNTSISNVDVGINTSIVSPIAKVLEHSDIGCNTSVIADPRCDVSTNEIGINTSIINAQCTAESSTNTSLVLPEIVEGNGNLSDELKSPDPNLEPLLTTPNKKIEPRSAIESIEGFKLEVKSLTKTKDEKEVGTPGKLDTPNAKTFNALLAKGSPFNTPKLNKGSPYSPAGKANLQQTIKQLEKLLQEAKKESDKKASIIVTRNNAIQQLESQLSNLEKKTNIKKIVEEKQALHEQISSFTQQVGDLNSALGEKNELLAATNNEVKVWIAKTETLQSEVDELKVHATLYQQESDKRQEELQSSIDAHVSKISILANLNADLKKELEPIKVALAELEDEKKILEQKNEEQLEVNRSMVEKEKVHKDSLSQRNNEVDSLKRQLEEKEQVLSKMEQERDKLIASTEKLRKQMDDRRKSRVMHQDTLESSLEGYRQRIDVMKQENDDNLKEISVLSQTVFETKSKAEDDRLRYEETLALKNEEIEQKEKLKSELVEKVEILEERITEYEVETTKMTSSNMRMMMKVNRLESDIVDKEEANDALKNDMQELVSKQELLCYNNEALSAEISDLKRKEVRLTDVNEAHFNKIIKLEDELNAKTSDCSDFDRRLSEARHDLDGKEKKIEELEKESNERRVVSDGQINKINELEKKLGETEGRYEDLVTKMNELQEEKSTSSQSFGVELERIKEDLESALKKNRELEEEDKKSRSLIEEKSESVRSLTDELDEVKKVLEGKLSTITELEEEKKKSRNLIEEKLVSAGSLTDELNEVKRDLAEKVTTISELEQENEKNRNLLEEASKSALNLANERDILKKDIESKVAKISELEEEKSKCSSEFLNGRDELKKELESKSARITELEEESKRSLEVVKEKEKLEKDLETKNARVSELEEELEKNLLLIKAESSTSLSAAAKLDMLKEDVESKVTRISELEEENKKSRELIESLTAEAEEVHEETNQYISKISKYEAELSENKELVQSLLKDSEELLSKNRTAESMIEQLKEEKKELEGKLENDKELVSQSTNVDVLIKQLNESKNQNEDYLRELNKYKTELSMKEEYENEADGIRIENKQLKSDLKEHEKTIKQMKKDLTKTTAELKKAKEERQNALDELLAKDLAAEVQPVMRRSARKSRAVKSVIENSQEASLPRSPMRASKISDITNCSSASKLESVDERDCTIVEEISIACSPLQLDGGLEMESTRCDHDTQPTRTKSKLVTTLDLNATEDVTTTSDMVTPAVPRKKKRLLPTNTSVFEASPDGVERTTANTTSTTNTSILDATMPQDTGKRVTRQTRSARKK